jgi:hypothetical protein
MEKISEPLPGGLHRPIFVPWLGIEYRNEKISAAQEIGISKRNDLHDRAPRAWSKNRATFAGSSVPSVLTPVQTSTPKGPTC